MQAKAGDKSDLKEWKKALQNAHELVTETVSPLMHGWLLSPKDGKLRLCSHRPLFDVIDANCSALQTERLRRQL